MAGERVWGSRYCTPGITPCPVGRRTGRGEPLPISLPKSREAVGAAGELGWTRMSSGGGSPPLHPTASASCTMRGLQPGRAEPKVPPLRPCFWGHLYRLPGLPALTACSGSERWSCPHHTDLTENSPRVPGALGVHLNMLPHRPLG